MVPISSWPGYEYVYLASKLGLDAKNHLDISLVQYADPQAIVHAYLRGELSVAQLTTVEVIDLCSRAPARCPTIVLVLDESRGGDQLMLRRGLSGLSELRGKRVGVTPSTLGPYVLSRALDHAGLSLQDVNVRNLNLDAMPDALAQGTIDAAAIFPPFSTIAQHKAGARTVFDSRQIPGEVFDVLAVEPGFLGEHQDQIVALVRAWQAAHHAAAADPARAMTLMAKREQISVEEFRQAESGLVYFSLEQQQAMLAEGGLIARNIGAVHRVQRRLGLVPEGSVLPRVSNAVVIEARQ